MSAMIGYGLFIIQLKHSDLKLKNILMIICGIMIFLIGLSRIYLGVHYFSDVLGVNLIGTYLVSKHVGKCMLEKSCGKIINIASDNGIDLGYPESCEYDASKAGVISLTSNMAKHYAPYINVNCVCPGWIDTDMNKDLSDSQKKDICDKILVKRFASVKEISNVVLFLASDDASYVNDSIIEVNGGSL